MSRNLAACLLLLGASGASAEPGLARMFRGKYGYDPACTACHSQGGGTPLNAYGKALEKSGLDAKGLAAIEALDSDGDGKPNLAEIKAKANPGVAASTPERPGDWLDPSQLIPKEVQQLFPAARTYKPLDAIFTAAEIERAKALGVELGAKDETTIYVPFEAGQAVGAAVIVPAAHGAKPFFLVVAADRALAVKAVAPMGAKDLPAAGSDVYGAFSGKSAKEIQSPADPSSLEGAIASAVKRAATILHVRLTKK